MRSHSELELLVFGGAARVHFCNFVGGIYANPRGRGKVENANIIREG